MPLPKRSKSMVVSPCASRNTPADRMRKKPALPLLSDINAFEARPRSTPPRAEVLSAEPALTPRTPILRVKRQKRPLRPPPSVSTVLQDTLRTNTPSLSPTTFVKPSPDTTPVNRKRKAPTPPGAFVVAKSIRHLVGEQSRKSARLILVDGQDQAEIKRIREEVMRRQSEKADQVFIRLVDASMMASASDITATTVEKFTICTI
jgi:hypothetical protein